MKTNDALRTHLSKLLIGHQAHASWEDVILDIPSNLRGVKPKGAPHTPWQLFEHMRIAQWDILEFSRSPDHVSPKFPEGYWPKEPSPPDAGAWERSLAAFRSDLEAMEALVTDPSSDLLTPFPHGTGQTLLREALLVADHNAYHLGQLVLLRRLLDAWRSESEIEGLSS
jgi:hypothetical protein